MEKSICGKYISVKVHFLLRSTSGSLWNTLPRIPCPAGRPELWGKGWRSCLDPVLVSRARTPSAVLRRAKSAPAGKHMNVSVLHSSFSTIGETYEKFIIFIPLLSIHYLVELFELEGNEDYFYFIFILCLFKHNTVSSFNNSPSILRKTLRCFYCGSFDHQRLNYFKFNLYCPHWMFAQISWLAAMC